MPIFGLHNSFLYFDFDICLVLRVSQSVWTSQVYRTMYSVN